MNPLLALETWWIRLRVRNAERNIEFLEEVLEAYRDTSGIKDWRARASYRFAALVRLEPLLSVERALEEEILKYRHLQLRLEGCRQARR